MNVSDPEFSRNLGFMSKVEQEALNNATVSIAGAGGDGGALAVQLARMGVGTLRLADPEVFGAENINRQACSTQATVGVNKAQAVGSYVGEINSDIVVKVYADGVTRVNVDQFVKGASLVIDETELTMPAIGVMIARAARAQGLANLMAMNIGFGTTVTSFHPQGKTFEGLLGLSEQTPLETIKPKDVPLSRWLSYLPPYVDLQVFKQVASGEKSAPSLAPGVALAAGTAAIQAFLHLTQEVGNNRPRPIYSPRTLMIDAYTGHARVIRYPRLSHYRYLAIAACNNGLRRVPIADY